MTPRRRTLLRGAAAAPLALLGGCTPPAAAAVPSRWVGAAQERGHRLREPFDAGRAPDLQRSAGALVVGAGIAGLACARALARAGIDDVQLFDLEDVAGGNSRGHAMAGMACPLGAHYLPLPGPQAHEVAELLDGLGLRRVEHGRPVYDERHLCHSPQERLYIAGHWHDGLLPPPAALPAAERRAAAEQYARFARAVRAASVPGAFAMPTARATWSDATAALDGLSFAAWLDAQGLTAPALRWYLDYCCRDDYGAGAAAVSAWAGVHYFASRHGFHPAGEEGDEPDGVLTWPQGNAWLAQRLAEPLAQRTHTGCIVRRVVEGRRSVEIDLWNAPLQRHERWSAPQAVLAVPLFVARRLVDPAPAALVQAAEAQRHAPWLVANLQLDAPPADRPGAPPSWDNVLYASPSLGYVDAMHQSTRQVPGPTVLSAYWALGGDTPAQAQAGRTHLLGASAADWTARVLADLATAHPDLPARVRQADLMRYGHAMSIPAPGTRGSAALRTLAQPAGRLHFAHTDLSGYSVFEEALYQGSRAAADLIRASAPRSPPRPPARRG